MTPRWLRTGLTIAISVVVALVLTIIPLPNWGEALRPTWVALVVFYWVLALPERFNIGWAWLIGLLLDALTGNLLGAHALALVLVAILASRWHLKMRMYPMWQQSLGVGLALVLYTVILFWIGGIAGHMNRPLTRFVPVVIGTLIWPWVYAVLRRVRQRFVPA
ncbi:MAG: rod shape-determining protein MreD [Gammaproteobacteria bacterium]